MKLGKQTLDLLSNFSSINQNLQFKTGNVLETMAQDNSVIARVEIEETFDRDFPIYDLPEFLGAIKLVGNPELTFEDKQVILSNDSCELTYRYSDANLLTSNPKKIKTLQKDLEFNFSAENLKRISEASAQLKTLGDLMIVPASKDGSLDLKVMDSKDSTSHFFKITVECKNSSGAEDFSVLIPTKALNLFPGNYSVAIDLRNSGMIHLTNDSLDLDYWIPGVAK